MRDEFLAPKNKEKEIGYTKEKNISVQLHMTYVFGSEVQILNSQWRVQEHGQLQTSVEQDFSECFHAFTRLKEVEDIHPMFCL